MHNLLPFAIRVLKDKSTGQRKLISGEFYYLVQGFNIVKNGEDEVYILINQKRLEPDNLYNEYIKKEATELDTDISISAIVGENGSGKSTLVELFLRIINNFAAATIGEREVYSNAEHLHYINGMEVELYYLKDFIPYRIRVCERNVELQEFVASDNTASDGSTMFIPREVLFDNGGTTIKNVALKDGPMEPWRPDPDQKVDSGNAYTNIYKPLFYTYVSNFSIYAYNPNDYAKECNSEDFERIIRRGNKNSKYSIQDRCWLKGLFHKNDGYQTPIVLNPMRNEGNIDINTENKLARERLVAILVNPNPNNTFDTINGHLKVQGFSLDLIHKDNSPHALNRRLGFQRMQGRGYERLRTLIPQYWQEILKVTFNDKLHHYREAIDYLVYKTLKISSVYSQYRYFYNNHYKAAYKIDENMLKNLVKYLSKDHSHITRKVREILAYLVFSYCETDSQTEDISLAEIRKQAEPLLSKGSFITSIDELAPPPIYDATLKITEGGDTNKPILFNTLSSGERQIAYSVSSILYHLTNIESVWDDDNNTRLKYDSFNIILEEIELYFHPDLQRKMVKFLLDGLAQCHLPNIKSIHIAIITHSPFILSDIPKSNILTLKKDGDIEKNADFSSFGANIHEMLHHHFFLNDGSIGEFAKWKIRSIVKRLDNFRSKINHKVEDEKSLANDDMIHVEADAQQIYNDICLIDEPILRRALMDDFNNIFVDIVPNQAEIDEIDNQIARLQEKRKKLCGNSNSQQKN